MKSATDGALEVCWNDAAATRVFAIASIDDPAPLMGMAACQLPPAGTVVSIGGKAWRAGHMTAARSVPLEPVFDVYSEAIR